MLACTCTMVQSAPFLYMHSLRESTDSLTIFTKSVAHHCENSITLGSYTEVRLSDAILNLGGIPKDAGILPPGTQRGLKST